MPPTSLFGPNRDLASGSKPFFRSWGTPDREEQQSEQRIRMKRYGMLWDLYEGTAFDDFQFWQDYKSHHALYRSIRMLWDHTHSLVDFYADHVWSGALAKDGLNLPNGVRNAVPIAPDTDPKLAAAIGATFHSWDFRELMSLIPRYTAALGEFLVELTDDPRMALVQATPIWSGWVFDVQLDLRGRLTSYVISYYAKDKDGRPFVYRREVDEESFRTFRDGRPWDYLLDVPEGPGSVIENPYGFAPAVWFRHIRKIGVRGEPALYATQGRLDDLNSLLSNAVDKTHVNLRAPVVISGTINPTSFKRALQNMGAFAKRRSTSEAEDPHSPKEELNIIQGPVGTDVKTVEVSVGDVMPVVEFLTASIERTCPEVVFYEQMRGMTQITGSAATNLLGDVDSRLQRANSTYDPRLVELVKKHIAIASWRRARRDGEWGKVQYEVYDGFDLDDYHEGNLDHEIMPRPLVPSTEKENLELLQLKRTVMPFIPDEVIGVEAGYDKTLVEGWVKEFEESQLEQQQQELDQQKELIEAKGPVGAPPGGPQRGQPNQKRREQPKGRRQT